MADRKRESGPQVPEAVCPTCGVVHSPGELCTRYALSLALEAGEAEKAAPVPPPGIEQNRPKARGQFHHYRIAAHPDGTLWELGSGAMGITYKAHDERLKLDVALKVINNAFMNDRGAQALFLREARAAARVRHSNVASVLFLNDTPGNIFYAMEFVAGEALNVWLANAGTLTPLTAIDIARQLASGLGAIHAEGLVHRDLKPANVLLLPAPTSATSAGLNAISTRSTVRVKIIDFGVAREITTDSDAVSTIGFRGTVAYASPEQCEEHYDLDGRSDLYSLGCMLFEMLAGRPPFSARSRRAFLNLHVGEPPPIGVLRERPPVLVDIVARLLAKQPEDRFPDAQALIEALDRAQLEIEQAGTNFRPTATSSSKFTDVARNLGTVFRSDRGLAPSAAATAAALARRRRGTRVWIAWGLMALVAIGMAWRWLPRPQLSFSTPMAASTNGRSVASTNNVPPAAAARQVLAVLPFANLSPEKENGYVAEGLRADILAQLARIHDLKVISRISPGQYQSADPAGLRKLAQDLGVTTVLEGSVRRAGTGLRVNVQLVDTATAENIWVESFDGDATNVFAMQSQVALSVADRLNVSVVPAEKTALMRPPTGSAAAYQFFLKGRGLMSDAADTRKNLDEAAEAFTAATTADPNFALAHAQLSMVHTLNYLWGRDHTDVRLELARKSAETAIRLQPDLPEAQVAMGNYYYRGFRDYSSAQPYFERAVATMPGNLDALIALAAIERRQGRWNEAATRFMQAGELAPFDPILQFNVANTFLYMHQYERAAQLVEAAIKRIGVHPALSKLNGETYVVWKGDLEPMRRDLATRPPNAPSVDLVTFDKITLRLLERRFDDALELLRTSNFTLADGEIWYFTRDMVQAEILTQAGRAEEAREAWQRALPSLAQSVTKRPDDARLRLAYALALAGTGDSVRSTSEATTASELISFKTDALEAPYFLHGLALVHARNGNIEDAKLLVQRLVEIPSAYSAETFRLSPAWDAVRN